MKKNPSPRELKRRIAQSERDKGVIINHTQDGNVRLVPCARGYKLEIE